MDIFESLSRYVSGGSSNEPRSRAIPGKKAVPASRVRSRRRSVSRSVPPPPSQLSIPPSPPVRPQDVVYDSNLRPVILQPSSNLSTKIENNSRFLSIHNKWQKILATIGICGILTSVASGKFDWTKSGQMVVDYSQRTSSYVPSDECRAVNVIPSFAHGVYDLFRLFPESSYLAVASQSDKQVFYSFPQANAFFNCSLSNFSAEKAGVFSIDTVVKNASMNSRNNSSGFVGPISFSFLGGGFIVPSNPLFDEKLSSYGSGSGVVAVMTNNYTLKRLIDIYSQK